MEEGWTVEDAEKACLEIIQKEIKKDSNTKNKRQSKKRK
jgi:hypothetical protein